MYCQAWFFVTTVSYLGALSEMRKWSRGVRNSVVLLKLVNSPVLTIGQLTDFSLTLRGRLLGGRSNKSKGKTTSRRGWESDEVGRPVKKSWSRGTKRIQNATILSQRHCSLPEHPSDSRFHTRVLQYLYLVLQHCCVSNN